MAVCQAAATAQKRGLDFHAPRNDPYAAAVQQDTTQSIGGIQKFFGAPFPDPIHFEMVAGRADFDAAVKKFDFAPTQCWMVGLGTADLMVLLSPAAWSKQACEHDPKDTEATRRLIAHELIHVYHGQFNPSRDFNGVDDLDWFIEGLAVYGSGQLTKERRVRLQMLSASDGLPNALAKIWTGPDRYALAGSLVEYVDGKWGRATTVRLLKTRGTKEALAELHTDEPGLLAGWKAWLTRDSH